MPSEGGALLVSNHSGALPPDAPMIMQAIRHEHSRRGRCTCWRALVQGLSRRGHAHQQDRRRARPPRQRAAAAARREPAGARVPRGSEGSRKLYWQRYRLRRFGRGGFVRTAMRAGVPIVPIAVVGAEEAMPIFAHVPRCRSSPGSSTSRSTTPSPTSASPRAHVPAREVQDPLPRAHRLSGYGAEDAEDLSLVQSIAEDKVAESRQRSMNS